MSRSARRRVLNRAVVAWQAGKPHTAWSILAEAGMEELWPYFLRTILAHNRTRYLTAVAPPQPPR